MATCPLCNSGGEWQQHIADVITQSITCYLKEVLQGIQNKNMHLMCQIDELMNLASQNDKHATHLCQDNCAAAQESPSSANKRAKENRNRSTTISSFGSITPVGDMSCVVLPGSPANANLSQDDDVVSQRKTSKKSRWALTHKRKERNRILSMSDESLLSMDDLEKDRDDELISQTIGVSCGSSQVSMDDFERDEDECSPVGQGCQSPQNNEKRKSLDDVQSMSMQEFRDAADTELVMRSTSLPVSPSTTLPGHVSSPKNDNLFCGVGNCLLCMYGLISWLPEQKDRAQRVGVSLSLLFVSGYAIYLSCVEPDAKDECIPMMCLALGNLISVVDLLWCGFRCRFEHLSRYMFCIGCTVQWHRKSLKRFIAILGLSSCVAISRFMFWMYPSCWTDSPEMTSHVQLLLQTISSLVIFVTLAVITHCHSHVDLALELCIERCTMDFVHSKGQRDAIKTWDTVQAIIRRTARTLEHSFLALVTSSLVLFVWSALSIFDSAGRRSDGERFERKCIVLHCWWTASPILLAMYVICCAAALTRRCSRTPAFINAVDFENEDANAGARVLVEHMRNSDAGLFIKGACVTPQIAIKLAYMLGVVCFTLLTRNSGSL